jgi:hypothetical protein
MTKDEALDLAQKALEDACGNRCNAEYNPCFQRDAINAIKAARGIKVGSMTREDIIRMAQDAGLHRQQHNLASNPVQYRFSYEGYEENIERFFQAAYAAGAELNTTPPQRTWVGLTDKDWNRSRHNQDFQKGVDWAEAMLKGKNI